MFTIRNLPLKAVASVMAILALGLLYQDLTTLRAPLRWQTTFDKTSRHRKKALSVYKNIYPVFKQNPSFLYNYGYELSIDDQNDKSLKMLQKAEQNMYNEDLLQRKGCACPAGQGSKG